MHLNSFQIPDAKHLYLIDLKGGNFSALVEKLKSLNPSVGVSVAMFGPFDLRCLPKEFQLSEIR